MSKGIKFKTIGAIAIVLVLLYVGFQVYQITYDPVKTITAQKETVYDSITKEAIFIRDESLITSQKSGTMVYNVSDGSRVEKGGVIANVFSSESEANAYAQLTDIEKQIAYYENIILQNNTGTAGLEVIDSNIESGVNTYVRSLAEGKLKAVNENSTALVDDINVRKITIGENIDVNSILNELYAKRKKLGANITKMDAVSVEEAGYFVSTAEGEEATAEYTKAAELSVANINNIIKNAKQKKKNNAVGKLVKRFDWYVACVVEKESITSLQEGSRVAVYFPQSDVDEQEATVAAINTDAGNPKNAALILQLGNMDENIAKIHSGKVEIRFDKYEGIKIPNDAIRAVSVKDEKTGEEKTVKCVYVLSGNVVKLKYIDILFNGGDFVIAKSNTTQTGYVRLYDRVIIKGDDLSDGKIVKYRPSN